jgi:hypothetical protein
MQIDVTNYLPRFLQSDPDFKAVCDAESIEHEKTRDALQDVFNQFFVGTATWGLSIWEYILDLHPAADEKNEYRRNQILNRIRGYKTTTKAVMHQIINTYGSGYLEEHNERYYFNVFVACNDDAAKQKLKEDIIVFKPAHLGINVYLGYSWNGDINFDGKYTFGTSQEDWSEM